MKKVKRLVALTTISFLVALGIGLGVNTSQSYDVERGFAFGQPLNQQTMPYSGTYDIVRWGFPATYREVHRFQPSEGASGDTYYTAKPFSPLLVVANVLLLMSFLVAILSPITIFWRPKNKVAPELANPSQDKLTEEKPVSQAEKDANNRH